MIKLRVAVVGLSHGATHIASVAAHPQADLVALVDQDAPRLDKLALAHDVRAFASVGALLDAQTADAVIIATPTQFHAEMSTQCLDAGLHVLLEKPLCRSDEEAALIGQAVQRSGRVLQLGYEVRSSPLHTSIMEHIRRGDLGELTNVWYNQHTDQSAYTHTWRDVRGNMGGGLFDCAVHYLDLMQQWAGAPVRRIVALGNVRGATGPCRDEVPESAAISIEYANGVRGTYNFGANNDFNDQANFGVSGTTGRIMGNPNHAGCYELRRDRGVSVSNVVFDPQLTSRGHLGFREEFDNFMNTILQGAPNVCSFAAALAIHRQMVAIDQSLATGEVVTLR